jgi:hypothetical protein
MSEPPRSYTSFIAGLRHRAPDGTHRQRYCARQLKRGVTVELTPEPDNPSNAAAIAVKHAGRHLGYIPKRHDWVAASLAAGDTVACSVDEIEYVGWPFKRAGRVVLRVDIAREGSAIGAAVQWSATSVTRAADAAAGMGGKALRVAAEVPMAAGRGALSAARWTGQNVAQPAVNVVYRGVDGMTDLAVRKPYRFIRRIVLWTIALVFGALGLVLAILILLHTLPRSP